MQISREQEDFYGEDIFGVTYRCVTTDRDLINNAARRMWRELGFGTKFKLLWLHRLLVLVTLAILVSSPPIWFINGNWEFDFLSWLLLISAIVASGIIFRRRYQWKIFQKELGANDIPLRFYGYEKAFVIYEDSPKFDSLTQKEKMNRILANEKWAYIANFEISESCLFLFTADRRVFLISNRDYRGQLSFEEVCQRVKSILLPLQAEIPPIAAPR